MTAKLPTDYIGSAVAAFQTTQENYRIYYWPACPDELPHRPSKLPFALTPNL